MGIYRSTWLMLVTLSGVSALVATTAVQAGGNSAKPALLPLSFLSAGALFGEEVRLGRYHPLRGAAIPPAPALPITCLTAPCRFRNVQASGGNGSDNPVNEVPIIVSPISPNQVLTAGNDFNCSTDVGYYRSSDGGASWSASCGALATGGAAGTGSDPIIGYDLNGTAYRGSIQQVGGVEVVVVSHTTGGGNWTTPVVAVPAVTNFNFADKPWLEIDTNAASPFKNTIYVSATQFKLNSDFSTHATEISVSHSTDGGVTWSTKLVDSVRVAPEYAQFTDLAVGADGKVYLTWLRCTANGPVGDCGATTASFYISISADQGNTWSPARRLGRAHLAPDACICGAYGSLPNTYERLSNIPVVAIDNSSGPLAGRLYVTYYTYTLANVLEVEITSSDDGGVTWSTPRRVSSGPRDQFFPWINISNTGEVGVTWLDRRLDSANINFDSFGAFSEDGGATFTRLRLSTVSSNPFNDGDAGQFLGDYIGNSWTGHFLYSAWPDTRNGVNAEDEVGGLRSQ